VLLAVYRIRVVVVTGVVMEGRSNIKEAFSPREIANFYVERKK